MIVQRGSAAPRSIPVPDPPGDDGQPLTRNYSTRFALALLAVIVVGAALLSTRWTTQAGVRTPVVDAVFTAVSASAVTGLVTVDTATHWNWFGQLVVLVLLQIGGLGFMVGTSLVFQVLRRGALNLDDSRMVQEGGSGFTIQEAVDLSRRIALFTFAVEGIGATVLMLSFLGEMPVRDAAWHGIFYATAAFSNAGFDLTGNFASLVSYDTSISVNLAIMLLIQAGSLSYLAFEDAWRARRWDRLQLDTKIIIVMNAALVLFGWLAFLLMEWNASLTPIPAGWRPLAALFQSVAARTAGYATINWGSAHFATLFIWILLMGIGGASGSTAGGVKMNTAAVFGSGVLASLRGKQEAELFRRTIPVTLVYRSMAVIALFFLTHFTITLLLGVTERLYSGPEAVFSDYLFEVMSALSTTGLTTGITPLLSDAGKLLICVAMFIGRLGPLTLAWALQRRSAPVHYRYATGQVRIG